MHAMCMVHISRRPCTPEEPVISPEQTTSRTGGIVATLAFTGTVAAIMQTLVTPLISELPQLLHTSPANASWVITATLLSAAVFVPISGRLGDLLGKRRMLLACCIPLLIGSVLCALTSSVVPMIIGRALQGMGMGLVPLGISLLRDVLPPQRLGSAIALVSASMGIGGGLGLPIAAAVADYASWRALFWGAGVLTVAIIVMIWSLVPAPATRAAAGGASTSLAPWALGRGWSACCCRSPRVATGAGAAPGPSACSPSPQPSCCCGGGGSCAARTRWWTCG